MATIVTETYYYPPREFTEAEKMADRAKQNAESLRRTEPIRRLANGRHATADGVEIPAAALHLWNQAENLRKAEARALQRRTIRTLCGDTNANPDAVAYLRAVRVQVDKLARQAEDLDCDQVAAGILAGWVNPPDVPRSDNPTRVVGIWRTGRALCLDCCADVKAGDKAITSAPDPDPHNKINSLSCRKCQHDIVTPAQLNTHKVRSRYV